MRQILAGIALALAATPAFAEEAHKGGLPQLKFGDYPPQIFWLVVAFIVLFIVLKGRILPKLAGAIEHRAAHIKGNLDQAAKLKAEAEAAVAAYEKALADARQRASLIAADAKAKVEAESAKAKAELEAKLHAETTAAEARIRAAKDAAMAEVGALATEAAQAITAKIAGLDLDRATVAAAVNGALALKH
jgi:F-type H+-transporting ATPase subunit b